MAKIIAISNQKGGVAKTTTTQAIAAVLSGRGYKVLAVDFDPQGNLSDSVNATSDNTVYEVLKQAITANEAVQALQCFDVISANILLASADQTLAQTGKEYRLKEALEPVNTLYDYIIIDTPPSLGLLTINAFTAADEIIIPTTAGKFAVKGISELFNTVKNVKKYCNPHLKIRGILFTKFDPRTNNSKDMKMLVEKLSEALETPLFNTYIRNRVAVDEAQARSRDILTFSGCEDIAADYNKFIDEYLEREYDKKPLKY
ncbi:MAG: AAA family ATPase [Oscillospiraceae bacterium]|jgi:chromosome partitioning protein|nr:AAA family ATPase [Oscillospiraceae bacterium]